MTTVFFRTLIIYVAIVFAVRIMGKRQIGELKPHELVITILISAVATVPLQSNSIPLSYSLVPIFLLISLEILQSGLCMKSLKFRNLVQGKPIFVIRDGKLQQNALTKLRFTLDDLIDALRQQEAFNIDEIQNAVIETNGVLSVQKKAEFTPISPSVMKIIPKKSTMPITIVMDSEYITDYFVNEYIDKKKIDQVLSAQNVKIEQVMLLTIDEKGKTLLIKKEDAQ